MGNCEYFVLVRETVSGKLCGKQCVVRSILVYVIMIAITATQEESYSGWLKVKSQQCVEERWVEAVVSVCRFLWWMWQPLWYLMSLRHGWWIVGECSFLCCWHRTAAQWIWCLLTVCHSAVTMDVGWRERGGNERSWKSQNRVLHSVALCVTLFVGLWSVIFV